MVLSIMAKAFLENEIKDDKEIESVDQSLKGSTAAQDYISSGGELRSQSQLNASIDHIINAIEAANTWYTYQTSTVIEGWTLTTGTASSQGAGGLLTITTASASSVIVDDGLAGPTSSAQWRGGDGKKIKIKVRLKCGTGAGETAGNRVGWGLCPTVAECFAVSTSISAVVARFVWDTDKLYSVTSDGTTNNSNEITGITREDWNIYQIIWNSATSIEFWVNGALKFTHTENIAPTNPQLAFGAISSSGTKRFRISNAIISLEL